MAESCFSKEIIVRILNQAATGRRVTDICSEFEISETTFFEWCSKYVGMTLTELLRLRQLESENMKLKKTLADTILDKQILEDLLSKKL
jgi:putative transposase